MPAVLSSHSERSLRTLLTHAVRLAVLAAMFAMGSLRGLATGFFRGIDDEYYKKMKSW
jgi:hypothetical protein